MPLPNGVRREARASGERRPAAREYTAHQDGCHDQMAHVDQAGAEGLAGEPGAAEVRSRSAVAFICRTASASKPPSIRVRSLDTVSRVLEYTTLSAACHAWA